MFFANSQIERDQSVRALKTCMVSLIVDWDQVQIKYHLALKIWWLVVVPIVEC